MGQMRTQHRSSQSSTWRCERSTSARGTLLFDETDALFEKRGEVRDGHDRYANRKVNYLLPGTFETLSLKRCASGNQTIQIMGSSSYSAAQRQSSWTYVGDGTGFMLIDLDDPSKQLMTSGWLLYLWRVKPDTRTVEAASMPMP